MKKSKRFIECLNTGIFPVHVSFSVGYTYEEIIAYYKKIKAHGYALGLNEDKALIDGGTFFALKRTVTIKTSGQESTYFYLILKRPFEFCDWDMIMLAHECLHLCQFILPEILDRNREYESEAYLHSHLMTQALKLLRK